MKLDDIKAAADQKYKPFEVEDVGTKGKSVFLRSPVQLSDADRHELNELLTGAEVDNMRERVERVLVIAATTKAGGTALVTACQGNLATLMGVIQEWVATVKVGEASPSVS